MARTRRRHLPPEQYVRTKRWKSSEGKPRQLSKPDKQLRPNVKAALRKEYR